MYIAMGILLVCAVLIYECRVKDVDASKPPYLNEVPSLHSHVPDGYIDPGAVIGSGYTPHGIDWHMSTLKPV